ncbi:MAG: leucyl aminopeptidase family protein [Limimaricola sp.]|uniref:leucyl aminopeptidase family protein n=1 Tax=Limimaricola sp. TaxID=2211665 RepID=UPI001D39C434|nr:leucyl aminopeptidase family protein [Limimaricola sp.]MBI1418802.1 leucyl aminopeptidase family protein [Limimaricola sp.]
MLPRFAPADATALPLHVVTPDTLEAVLNGLSAPARGWAQAQGFAAGPGAVLALPDATGAIAGAMVGLGTPAQRARGRFVVGGAASKLPAGTWRIEGIGGDDLAEAVLGWLLDSYRFDRYRKQDAARAELAAPEGIDAKQILALAEGEYLTRDLINTPAGDMGPAELETAARELAERHGAAIHVIVGDDLLTQNFPLIHAVGRASTRAPRLIDISWGSEGPSLTLVGKGVCFDTGGLDIKPPGSMGLMKKDMGGAATVLGLAHAIMATGQKLRLRVLIPAVENSIDGNAFRPQDILTSRKGLTVEINNTDAEGRLVLADALTLGSEGKPDLMISMATLTGAARVAVGPDLAPFYTDDDAHAAALSRSATQVRDPVWRMPFHAPYDALIEPGIADLDNAPGGGMAGSITAALFLRRFADAPYMHFDIYGWQPSAAPGRPRGGVGMGARALFAALPEMLGA